MMQDLTWNRQMRRDERVKEAQQERLVQIAKEYPHRSDYYVWGRMQYASYRLGVWLEKLGIQLQLHYKKQQSERYPT